jgi:hypothetical protein
MTEQTGREVKRTERNGLWPLRRQSHRLDETLTALVHIPGPYRQY